MNIVDQQLSGIKNDTYDTHTTVQNLGQGLHYDKITRWLSPVDASVNYEKAQRQRHNDTGKWYLLSSAYLNWKARPSSTTWLYGIPGCGKTVLSSTVIEDLITTVDQRALLYFFFDSNDTRKQSFDDMIRSLVCQLYQKQEITRTLLDSLFNSYQDGQAQPPISKICTTLFEMLREMNEVWIVLDALDECKTRSDNRDAYGILPWIRHITTSKRVDCRMVITSREEEDIKSAFTSWIHPKSVTPIQGEAVTNDIRAYIRYRVHNDNELSRWQHHSDVQDEIETRVAEKAGVMLVVKDN